MTGRMPNNDYSFSNAAILLELQSIYLLTPQVSGRPVSQLHMKTVACFSSQFIELQIAVLVSLQGSHHMDFNTGGDFEGRFDAQECMSSF